MVSDATNPARFGFAGVTTGANDSHHVFSADGRRRTHPGNTMLADDASACWPQTRDARSGA